MQKYCPKLAKLAKNFAISSMHTTIFQPLPLIEESSLSAKKISKYAYASMPSLRRMIQLDWAIYMKMRDAAEKNQTLGLAWEQEVKP